MDQLSFSDTEFQTKKRPTRRELFLAELEQIVPWQTWYDLVDPHYFNTLSGQRQYSLPTMLRIHCMQLCYNFSDPAMEDALYEITSMRRFARLHLDKIPDETTILNFRHLLEKHALGKKLFTALNQILIEKKLILREGTVVDASIIHAPTAIKNKDKARDPAMHSTKKGKQYFFGMKVHVGVDDAIGLVHSLTTTAANAHDITETSHLLHGDEQRIMGDAGYQGLEKRKEMAGCKADLYIALRPSKRKKLEKDSPEAKHEWIKSSLRAKVEHVFFSIKQRFGYSKARYRGLSKNENRLYLLASFHNLFRVARFL